MSRIEGGADVVVDNPYGKVRKLDDPVSSKRRCQSEQRDIGPSSSFLARNVAVLLPGPVCRGRWRHSPVICGVLVWRLIPVESGPRTAECVQQLGKNRTDFFPSSMPPTKSRRASAWAHRGIRPQGPISLTQLREGKVSLLQRTIVSRKRCRLSLGERNDAFVGRRQWAPSANVYVRCPYAVCYLLQTPQGIVDRVRSYCQCPKLLSLPSTTARRRSAAAECALEQGQEIGHCPKLEDIAFEHCHIVLVQYDFAVF